MSELEICKYCGKPIMRGEVWNPDENGNGYHHACLIDIEFNENKKRVERLAQKSILDKIRAEIIDLANAYDYQQAFNHGLMRAAQIIDKYRKEQEDNGFFDEIMDDESEDEETYEKIKEIIDKIKEQEE